MITGLDHIVLLARDIDTARQTYETLLGVRPAWRTDGDGVATVIFTLGNTSLEIMAPSGSGPTAARVISRLDADGEGLASLCFRVSDIDRYQRRLKRIGLQPEDVAASGSTHADDGTQLSWRRTRSNVDAAHGVRLFFLAPDQARPRSAATADAPITGLDHVVVTTPQPERAAALYGARLGLDMQRDLTIADWKMRLMLFRCGDLTVEVAHRLDADASDGSDRLWGLSWRTADIAATHRRLVAAGVDVTGVRDGRKPGTRVLSVNAGTLGVPTLVIQQDT